LEGNFFVTQQSLQVFDCFLCIVSLELVKRFKVSNFNSSYKSPTEESYKYLLELSCKAFSLEDVNGGPDKKIVTRPSYFSNKKKVDKKPLSFGKKRICHFPDVKKERIQKVENFVLLHSLPSREFKLVRSLSEFFSFFVYFLLVEQHKYFNKESNDILLLNPECAIEKQVGLFLFFERLCILGIR
jgi:hypothetical protein